jgi:CdiI immunity protein
VSNELTAGGAGEMKYKALPTFLRGYLHQDFRSEYASPDAAILAFCDESSAGEKRRLADELEHFLASTGQLPFDRLREILCRELGSGWHPADRSQLVNLLGLLRERIDL